MCTNCNARSSLRFDKWKHSATQAECQNFCIIFLITTFNISAYKVLATVPGITFLKVRTTHACISVGSSSAPDTCMSHLCISESRMLPIMPCRKTEYQCILCFTYTFLFSFQNFSAKPHGAGVAITSQKQDMTFTGKQTTFSSSDLRKP